MSANQITPPPRALGFLAITLLICCAWPEVGRAQSDTYRDPKLNPITGFPKEIVIKIGANGTYEDGAVAESVLTFRDGGKAGKPVITFASDGTGNSGVLIRVTDTIRPERYDKATDTYEWTLRMTVKLADLKGSKTGKTHNYTVTASCKEKNQQSIDSVQKIKSIPIRLEKGTGDPPIVDPPTPTPKGGRINLAGKRGSGIGSLQRSIGSSQANRINLRAGRTGGGGLNGR